MKIDWKSFLSQYDLIYENAPTIWQDGLPIGNGSMAALFYAPHEPQWIINKSDVWDYRAPNIKFMKHEEVLKKLDKIIKGRDPKDVPDDAFHEMIHRELGKEEPPEKKYPSPKSCGNLRIRTGLMDMYSTAYKMSCRTSLHEATLGVSMHKHLSHPKLQSFVHKKKNVLAVRMSDVSMMHAWNNSAEIYRTSDVHLPPAQFGAKGDRMWLIQKFPDGLSYVMMAKVVPQGAHAYRKMMQKTVRKIWWMEPTKKVKASASRTMACATVVGDFDIFVTAVTSLESKNPMKKAEKIVEAAARAGFKKLHAEHKKAWADFWRKSFVQLHNKFFEGLWYYSLYAAASSMGEIPPAAGICGLWFGHPNTPGQNLPWHGAYVNDYNAELPVMPVFQANHPELADGHLKTFLNMLPQVKKDTRKLYGIPGAMVPLCCSPDGRLSTGNLFRYIHSSGPEWGQLFLWRYYYTKDRKFLKEVIYPFLREVVIFFENYLTFDEKKGRYMLHPSQEAEYAVFKPNPISTLMFLKYSLKGTIEAAKLLGRDRDHLPKWEDILDKFPDYPTDGNEYLAWEGMEPDFYNTNHRSTISLYPCGEIHLDSPKDILKTMKTTYERIAEKSPGSYDVKEGVNGSSGKALRRIMPAIRLGEVDHAWDMLTNEFLRSTLKPSGLISHNQSPLAYTKDTEANIKNVPNFHKEYLWTNGKIPISEVTTSRWDRCATENYNAKETVFPALEGNSAFIAIIDEMLMQCWDGKIILFPGFEKGGNARFDNLRAEGAFLVSSEIEKGKVKYIRIKSLAGGTTRIRNPWKGKTVLMKCGRTVKMKPGKYIDLKMRKGETIYLALSAARLREPGGTVKGKEQARPRYLQARDGYVMWYGKPDYPEYYGKLRRGMQA